MKWNERTVEEYMKKKRLFEMSGLINIVGNQTSQFAFCYSWRYIILHTRACPSICTVRLFFYYSVFCLVYIVYLSVYTFAPFIFITTRVKFSVHFYTFNYVKWNKMKKIEPMYAYIWRRNSIRLRHTKQFLLLCILSIDNNLFFRREFLQPLECGRASIRN